MSISDLVGNTPFVELKTPGVEGPRRLLAKLEGSNPGGSVKDRAARFMIRGAIERGELKKGMRLVEPTSGNTGIALAMIAAAEGFDIDLVMPEHATIERVKVMRAYGANVILTPTGRGIEGSIDIARQRAKEDSVLMLDQFSNDDNWRAHVATTGPEIWKETAGKITHFVSAMGTTGTIMGVSRYLKEQNPEVEIVGCQPTEGSKIPGIRRWSPEYLPKIFDPARVDRIIDVAQADAEECARSLASTEGVFCGISGGGAVWAARTLCRELSASDTEALIVCILPDRGDRYLSSPVFGPQGDGNA